MNILEELQWRGLVHQTTDEKKLHSYLQVEGKSMYCGFDPTAESLHIGNLIPLLSLVRMLKAGHKPIFLLGGATGMIGDPSGKDKERDVFSLELVAHRKKCIKEQIISFVKQNTGETPQVLDNLDWWGKLSSLDLLRDIGKHFSINWMLAKESVKGRIGREDTGISYTEFSYMILQSYDFYHLAQTQNCWLQVGGGDQWGNITSGCEFIRRRTAADGIKDTVGDDGAEAFALTFPLITTADGKKFGKSEKGAIFMNKELTLPYEFYQFWINTDDRDVIKFLKYYTFLEQDEINEIEKDHIENPHLRNAHKRLAAEVTIIVHGKAELKKVLLATEALFGSGDIKAVEVKTLEKILEAAPCIEYAKNAELDILEILVNLGLETSKGQARKSLEVGAIYVNQEKITADFKITKKNFLGEKLILVRKGKKNYGLVKII